MVNTVNGVTTPTELVASTPLVVTEDGLSTSSKSKNAPASQSDWRGALLVGVVVSNRGGRVSGKVNERVTVVVLEAASVARTVASKVEPSVGAPPREKLKVLVAVVFAATATARVWVTVMAPLKVTSRW